MSSWKVWLEQRLCAYYAFLCYSELKINEQLARQQLKKKRLLLREVKAKAPSERVEPRVEPRVDPVKPQDLDPDALVKSLEKMLSQ